MPRHTPASTTKQTRLARKPGLPLHLQAESRLRALMAEPQFASGEQMLTDEVSLSKKWGISRNTLRAAIIRLVAEGRLHRVAGSGTRVLPAPVRSDASAWVSFTREMRDRGIVVKNFAVSLEQLTPPAGVAAALALPPGQKAWRLRRVRGWDEQIVILADSWLPDRLNLTGTENFEREPLYDVLRRVSQVFPASSQEEISAVAATEEVARALKIPTGSPVLLRSRRILDAQGQLVEFNLNWCQCARYALALELKIAEK